MKILSCKMLHKMWPTECIVRIVELVEQSAAVVFLNWSQYLLNEMLEDGEKAQEESKTKFHYSWLLILISFVVWSDPFDFQLLDVPVFFHVTKYQNLWKDKEDKIRQKDNNIEFFLHAEALQEVIKHQHRLRAATVQNYSLYISF